MKVSRTGEDVRVRLNLAEVHVVRELFEDLQHTLAPDALAPDDPVRQRLYPSGYADAEQAQAFRELTEQALRAERSERVDTCLAELGAVRPRLRTELTLDGEQADRWIRVLNDLRLTYGTRLGISEDEDYRLRPGDPDAVARGRYMFLTALQDLLVGALLD